MCSFQTFVHLNQARTQRGGGGGGQFSIINPPNPPPPPPLDPNIFIFIHYHFFFFAFHVWKIDPIFFSEGKKVLGVPPPPPPPEKTCVAHTTDLKREIWYDSFGSGPWGM